MATIPQVTPSQIQSMDEAAATIAHLLEEHFDEMGWREEERDERVAQASIRVDAATTRATSSK